MGKVGSVGEAKAKLEVVVCWSSIFLWREEWGGGGEERESEEEESTWCTSVRCDVRLVLILV